MINPTRRDDDLPTTVCVPREVLDLYEFMKMSFVPFTSQHEQIDISLQKAKAAMAAIPAANPAQVGEDRQEVLDSFAVEPKHDLATMRAYMNRFPAYAADIADLHIIVTNLAETDRELDAHDYARIEEARQRMFGCNVPPDGWTCSRAKGHDGPCASSPAAVAQDMVPDADVRSAVVDFMRDTQTYPTLECADLLIRRLKALAAKQLSATPPPSPAVASDSDLLDRAMKGVKVLRTMLAVLKLQQGVAVADEILAEYKERTP